MRRPMFFMEGEGAPTGGGTPPAAATPPAGTTLLSTPAAAPAPGAAPAPSPGWVRDDGSFSDGWLDRLPEDLRGNPSLKVIGSVTDLAKSYAATKSLVGKKLEMPGEGATPEQVAEWRKVVGAPEKPEGYLAEGAKSIRPDTIPEGLWDANAEKEFLSIAHKHSLPPGAVRDIMGYYGQHMATALQASAVNEAAMLQAEGAKLRTAWGKDYDSNLAVAQRMAVTAGLDPKTHPFFTSAEGVQAFAKIGRLLSEDKLVSGPAAGVNTSLGDRARDITDPKSTSVLARDYRGENGPERQTAAQEQLHQLYSAAKN